MGGNAQESDRNGEPDQGSDESPGAQPEKAVEVESADEREEVGDGIGEGFRMAKPAKESEWSGPEEVMESTAAADRPHSVEQGDDDEGTDDELDELGAGTAWGDEFGVLPESGGETDGEGEEGEAEGEAADAGGRADADEAIAPTSGACDPTAGMEEVAEAEEVEEGDDGEDGEAGDEDGDTEGGVPELLESTQDLLDALG